MLKKIKGLRGLAIIGALTAVVLGLSFAAAEAWWWREEEREVKTLRMALIPAEDIKEMIDAFEPVRQYLERELGMEIEMFKALDYTAVVEAMRAKRLELAFFGPFSFVLAAERANARAIVAGGDAYGNVGVYHSILITHRDSGLENINDIKARAGELTLSFADPASTSGHLIPRGYMEYIGISVDEDFREIIFAGGHDASILAVHARKVDFGATWEGPHERAIAAGLICPDDVFVIWRSDGIPTSPLAVRGDLDEALIQRIQQTFLQLPQRDPEAFARWENMWHGNEYYVAVTGADYEFVRQVAIGLGKLQP